MSDPVEVRNEQAVAGAPVAAPPAAPAVYQRSTIVPYGYKARQFVWTAVAVVDLFLILRFILVAAHAGDSGFTSIVYTVAGALAWPFQGVFGITHVSGHPLQWVCLLAIAVYTAAAWIVARLLRIAAAPPARGVPAY
jgi:hypothetical protein